MTARALTDLEEIDVRADLRDLRAERERTLNAYPIVDPARRAEWLAVNQAEIDRLERMLA